MKKMYIFLFLLVSFCGIAIGITYAYYSINFQHLNNLNTGELSFRVNGANGAEQLGTQLNIENLYPSDTYFIEKNIVVENSGSMAIKYKIQYESEIDESTLFDYTLVSFNDGITWEPIASAEYIEIHYPLEVNDSISIPVRFRLDSRYKNVNSLNEITRFSIIVTAVQYEDSLDISNFNVNPSSIYLTETIGVVSFSNFNPANKEEVFLSDSLINLNTSSKVTIDFKSNTNGPKLYGSWNDVNHFKFGYDSRLGVIWVEVNEYKCEYQTIENANFDAIGFMLLDHNNNNSLVSLNNIKINNQSINGHFIGDINSPKWVVTGSIKDENGDFVFEADLILFGHHASGEHSKVEIYFGIQ